LKLLHQLSAGHEASESLIPLLASVSLTSEGCNRRDWGFRSLNVHPQSNASAIANDAFLPGFVKGGLSFAP
jgi:hypothetical protein